MLLAELSGKSCAAARDSEDYLTSAVFGHLRYVPPGAFWDALLAHARGLPGLDHAEPSLAAALADAAGLPSSYQRLTAHFWRSHPAHGEPDLLLVFTAPGRSPLVLLIEVKLWAGKSGTGDNDQLARYLRVLDDLTGAGVAVPPGAAGYLIYLTPREARAEVEESLRASADPGGARARLFRLRWQDVLLAARGGAGGRRARPNDPFRRGRVPVTARTGILRRVPPIDRAPALGHVGRAVLSTPWRLAPGLLHRIRAPGRSRRDRRPTRGVGAMTDDYGKRVGLALRAVRQLYADTSRLLSDCDAAVGRGKPLATKNTGAVKDTYWSLGKEWMPEGAFRCYSPEPDARPGLVEAVCACFFGEKVAAEEPLLIVGRYTYRLAPARASRTCATGGTCGICWPTTAARPRRTPYTTAARSSGRSGRSSGSASPPSRCSASRPSSTWSRSWTASAPQTSDPLHPRWRSPPYLSP